MKTKLIALLVALILALSMMSCGPQENPDDGEKEEEKLPSFSDGDNELTPIPIRPSN